MAVDLGSAVGRIIIDGAGAAKGVQVATSALLKLQSTGIGIAGTIAAAGTSVAILGTAIGTGLAAGIGFAVDRAASFEQQMRNVIAISDATGEQFSQLSELALQLGQSTIFTAQQVGSAMEELVKGGISVEDILGGALAGTLDLAVAGNLDLAEAATIASVALNTFNLEGEDMAHVADLLANGANSSAIEVKDLALSLRQSGQVAKQFGLSIDETIGILSLFGSEGSKASDAGTSLRTFLLSLTNPTKKAQKAMQEFGLEFYDVNGNLKDMNAIAQNLQDSLGGLTEEQRNATLELIFGRDAIRAASILMEEGAEGVNKWVSEVGKVGEAQRVASERMNSLKGDVEQLSGAFETSLIRIGTAFIPAVRSIVQGLTDVVQAFNNSARAQAAMAKISEITVKVVQRIGEIAGPAVAAISSIFDAFATGDFNRAFGPLVAAMEAAFGSENLGVVADWANRVLRFLQLVRDGIITFRQALDGNWFGGQVESINDWVRRIGRATQLARDAILTVKLAAQGNWFGGADEGIQPVVRALGRVTQLIRDAAITAGEAFKGEWIDSESIAQPVRLVGQLVDGFRLIKTVFTDTAKLPFIDASKLSPITEEIFNMALGVKFDLIPALKTLGLNLQNAFKYFGSIFTPERTKVLQNMARAFADFRMDGLVNAVKIAGIVIPELIAKLADLTAALIDFIGWIQETPAASAAFRGALAALAGVLITNKLVDYARGIQLVALAAWEALTATKAWHEGLMRGPRAVVTVVTTIYKTVGTAAVAVGRAIVNTVSFIFANAQSAAIWAQLYAQQYLPVIKQTVVTTFTVVGQAIAAVAGVIRRTVITTFQTVGQAVNVVAGTIARTVTTTFVNVGDFIKDLPADITRTIQTVWAKVPAPPTLPTLQQTIQWVIPPYPNIQLPAVKFNITIHPATIAKALGIGALGGIFSGAGAAIGAALAAAILASAAAITVALVVALAVAVTAAGLFVLYKAVAIGAQLMQGIIQGIQSQGGLGPMLYNLFFRAIPYALGQVAGLVANGALLIGIAIVRGITAALTTLPAFISAHFQEIVGSLLIIFGGLPGRLLVFFIQFQTQIMAIFSAIGTFIGTIFSAIGTTISTALSIVGTMLTSMHAAVVAAFTSLYASIVAVFVNIGTAIVTFMTTIQTAVSTLIATLITNFINFGTQILTAFTTAFLAIQTAVSTFVATVAAAFMQLVTGDILGAVQTLASAFTTLFSSIISTVATFASSVASAFASVFSGIASAVSAFVSSVVSAFVTMGSSIISAVSGFISGVVSAFTTMGSAIVSAVSAAWSAVTSAVSAAMSTIVSTVTSAWSAVTSAVGAAMSAIGSAISSAWDGITSAISSALAAIGTAMSTAWASFVAGFQSTFSSGLLAEAQSAMSQLAAAISDGIATVLGLVSSLGSQIVGAIGDLSGLLFGVGQAAIQGLVNGITSMIGAVTAAAQSIASAIPGPIKGILGISSPSKLLAEIGEDTILGFIVGMDSQEQEAVDKAAGIAKNVADAIKSGVEAMTALRGFTSPGVGAIKAFVASMNTAIEEFSTSIAENSEKTLEAVEAYSKLIKSISETVEAGSKIAESISTYVAPTKGAIHALVVGTFDIVEEFASGVRAVSEEMLEDAKKWADVIKQVADTIKVGVESFALLAAFVRPSQKQIADFEFATEDLIFSFGDAAKAADTELVAHAATWAAAVGTVLDIVKDATEAFAAIIKFIRPSNKHVTEFREAIEFLVNQFGATAYGMEDEGTGNAGRFATAAKEVIAIVKDGVDALKAIGGFRRPSDQAIGDFKFAIEHLVRSFADTEVFLQSDFYAHAVAFSKAIGEVIGIVKPGIEALGLISGFVRPTDVKIGEFKFAIEHLVRSFGDTAIYLGTELPAHAKHFAEAAMVVVELVVVGTKALASLVGFVRPTNQAIGAFKFAIEHLVRSFYDTAVLIERLMLEAAKNFAEGAKVVVEVVGVGIEALSRLFFFAPPPQTAIFRIRDAILALVKAFSDAALSVNSFMSETASKFATDAKVVVELVDSALEALARIGRGVKAPDPTAMRGIANNIALLVRAIADASYQIAGGTVTVAAEFSEGALKVVQLVNEGVAALGKLRLIGNIDPGSVRRFTDAIKELVRSISEASQSMELTGLSAAEAFSTSASTVVGFVGSGVDALLKLEEASQVSVSADTMQSFADNIVRLVDAIYDASFAIEAGVADAASSFSESVKGVVDLVGSGVTALQGLSEFTPPSDAQIEALKAAMILTVNKIIEATKSIDQSLVEAAGEFSESAKKVLDLIKAGTDALTVEIDDEGKTKSRGVMGAGHIDAIVNAIHYALTRMIGVMNSFPAAVMTSLGKFGDNVQKAMSALKAAEDAIAPSKPKEGEVDPTARINNLIGQLSANLPLLQTLNSVAEQYRTAMVNAATAINLGFLEMANAVGAVGDAALVNAIANGGTFTIESHVLIERKYELTFRMMDENGPWIVRSLNGDVVSKDQVVDMVIEGLVAAEGATA